MPTPYLTQVRRTKNFSGGGNRGDTATVSRASPKHSSKVGFGLIRNRHR